MISSFSFKNPDGTIRVIDVATLFPPGSNASRITDFGISIADQFPDVCRQMAHKSNDLYHTYVNPDTDLYSDDDCIERIGIKLGQEIHRNLLQNETCADIWSDVADRMAFTASGNRKVNIYIVDNQN